MNEFSHKGFSHNRIFITDGSSHVKRENAFAKTWLEENPTLDYGLQPTLLALVPGCTQRDATVAATMMQWLGSPVGFNFLNKALADAGYKIVETK